MKKNLLFLSAAMCLVLSGCGHHEPPKEEEKEEQKAKVTVVNGTGGGEFTIGDTATVTATVPNHYVFRDWTSGGEVVSTQNPYTFTVEKDITLTANFNSNSVYITVVNGTGSGTYDIGSTVTVTPILASGEKFVEWQVEGERVSTESTYSFTATTNLTITAVIDKPNPLLQYFKNVYMEGDEFKVLNLADIQLHDGNDFSVTKHIVDQLVEKNDPDMIVILGDIMNDHVTYSTKDMTKNIVDLIDGYGIPWAPLFGNHDNIEYKPEGTKKYGGVEYMEELFAASENCLYTRGPSDVLGHSNYVVNVIDKDTNKYVESFVILDSFTHGLDSTNEKFYEDSIKLVKQLNNNVTVPSVVFDHIPIKEYLDAYKEAENEEFRTINGTPGVEPLVAGENTLFATMKELGSTKTVICGHDHQTSFFSEYQGITLAHGMKSSDGDDEGGDCYTNRMGGLMLTVDGKEDKLEYSVITDLGSPINSSLPFHPSVLPYWRFSGTKLVFDIDLPTNGSVKFNIQGTNLMRDSVSEDLRKGAWNRLTNDVTINADAKTAGIGTLTQVEGNRYHYEVDLQNLTLNNGSGEKAYGDETARLVYFHNASGNFRVYDVHYECEEITETDQLDLANAEISIIEEQYYTGLPSKPEPTVKLAGKTLAKGNDIIYTYKNHMALGQATLTIIPSGKGAHKYKGEKSVTFNIATNPDDDTLPGHETATTVNGTNSFVSNDSKNEFIKIPNWFNCGKLLHMELKRLANGLCKSGETATFSFMGADTNPVTTHGTQCDPNGTWNRLTEQYVLDFSDNQLVCYRKGNKTKVLATGVAMEDGWFSLDIDLTMMDVNVAENVLCNELETLQRFDISAVDRSFKFDKVSLVDKK